MQAGHIGLGGDVGLEEIGGNRGKEQKGSRGQKRPGCSVMDEKKREEKWRWGGGGVGLGL